MPAQCHRWVARAGHPVTNLTGTTVYHYPRANWLGGSRSRIIADDERVFATRGRQVLQRPRRQRRRTWCSWPAAIFL